MMSKESVFIWGPDQEKAYRVIKLKAEKKNPTMLHHFDSRKETSVIVDASPGGICSILTHEDNQVLFVSRKVSKVKARYF